MAVLSVKAIDQDFDPTTLTLREEDLEECHALGLTAEETLTRCIAASTEAWCVYMGGAPLCAWGYRAVGTDADVWLLTTPLVERYPIAFAKEALRLSGLLETLFTAIHVECLYTYHRSLSWLDRLGFSQTGSTAAGFVKLSRFHRSTQWAH